MRRKVLSLLSVFALLLVAAGGVAAAGHAGTVIGDVADDDVGICLVGADSPCNDAPDDEPEPDDREADHEPETDEGEAGEELEPNDTEDDQVFIPEDRDGDREIDDRFRGDDEANAGICLVGADSPCNGEPADGEQQARNDATEGDQAGTLEDDGSIVDRLAILLGIALPFGGGI